MYPLKSEQLGAVDKKNVIQKSFTRTFYLYFTPKPQLHNGLVERRTFVTSFVEELIKDLENYNNI